MMECVSEARSDTAMESRADGALGLDRSIRSLI